jgi:hypothetical protein
LRASGHCDNGDRNAYRNLKANHARRLTNPCIRESESRLR